MCVHNKYNKTFVSYIKRIHQTDEYNYTLYGNKLPYILKSGDHRRPAGEQRRKRKRPTIFIERTGEDHRQSDKRWNRLKGSFEKSS